MSQTCCTRELEVGEEVKKCRKLLQNPIISMTLVAHAPLILIILITGVARKIGENFALSSLGKMLAIAIT